MIKHLKKYLNYINAQPEIEKQEIEQLKDELAFGYVPFILADIYFTFDVLNIISYDIYVLMKYLGETKGNEYFHYYFQLFCARKMKIISYVKIMESEKLKF